MPPRMTRRTFAGLQRRDAALLTRPDGRYPHAYVPELANGFAAGRIDRRGFLRTACLLGVSASAAYAFAGRIDGAAVAPPLRAQDFPRRGGELRFAMEVMEITDPAAFAWPQQANISRWMVEYLTRTGPDNVTLPYLAEGWEASDDLKSWTFTLRREVRWSNGDRFTADDVVANSGAGWTAIAARLTARCSTAWASRCRRPARTVARRRACGCAPGRWRSWASTPSV